MEACVLTSAGVGLDVLHAADGGVVAVGHERRDRVQQAVHVAGGARVAQPILQRAQPLQPLPVLAHLHAATY